jgi:hypothetical protein
MYCEAWMDWNLETFYALLHSVLVRQPPVILCTICYEIDSTHLLETTGLTSRWVNGKRYLLIRVNCVGKGAIYFSNLHQFHLEYEHWNKPRSRYKKVWHWLSNIPTIKCFYVLNNKGRFHFIALTFVKSTTSNKCPLSYRWMNSWCNLRSHYAFLIWIRRLNL